MKAIVFERYGPPDVLQLKEIETPAPKGNEVRNKIHATSVTKYDCWVRSNTTPPGFGLLMRIVSGQKPKQPILGTELAGEIETVGNDVTRFKVGDQVYGYPGMNLGAYAEYICLPEDAVALKPANVTHEEAATVLQGALTALYFLRKANIQRGDKVLIFGEEIYYRGYLLPRMRGVFGKWDWVANGVLFTLKHVYQRWLYPGILVGGLSFAFAFGPLGSLPLAMLFHWIGNFLFQMIFLIMAALGVG